VWRASRRRVGGVEKGSWENCTMKLGWASEGGSISEG